MKIINLYETYRKVKQRARHSFGSQRKIAMQATEAAKLILESPTIKSVRAFKKFDNEWLIGARRNSISIADEFESAIRSKNYEIVKPYSSFQTDWDPEIGFLYCFASNDYPGNVKIGATEDSMELRLNTYKARRKLNHLKVVIAVWTKFPARKEKKIHDILHPHKFYPPTIKKSNEWFQITQKRAKELITNLA